MQAAVLSRAQRDVEVEAYGLLTADQLESCGQLRKHGGIAANAAVAREGRSPEGAIVWDKRGRRP